jgi:hypothetical protein
MGLDQFDRGGHLAPYYASRLCGAEGIIYSRALEGFGWPDELPGFA